MAPRTEKLTFVQFRGGSQPVTFEFQPNKKFVLIFGENGTGKSSIADAIDFVCNNEFGSLPRPQRHDTQNACRFTQRSAQGPGGDTQV